MLDTFVECSSLKSFTRGIEVDKVRYFFWKLYTIIKEKASTQDFSPSSNFLSPAYSCIHGQWPFV